MVFYFTATGNCRYVAEQLDNDARSIPQEMQREGELAYQDGAIGIVYPIYGHMMPDMVRRFVERAKFSTPYLYLVLTYGCRHTSTIELGVGEMERNGFSVSYASTLLMVDNWLPNFDMNEQRKILSQKHVEENLARVRADVAARKEWIEPVTDEDRAAHAQFLSHELSFEPAALQGFLAIGTKRCTGCDICSRVCPAGCIAAENGKAVRRATAGQGCNACLACIHACLNGAIALPMGEANPKARYATNTFPCRRSWKPTGGSKRAWRMRPRPSQQAFLYPLLSAQSGYIDCTKSKNDQDICIKGNPVSRKNQHEVTQIRAAYRAVHSGSADRTRSNVSRIRNNFETNITKH